MIDNEQQRQIENDMIKSLLKAVWIVLRTILFITIIHVTIVVLFFRDSTAVEIIPVLIGSIIFVVSLTFLSRYIKRNKTQK